MHNSEGNASMGGAAGGTAKLLQTTGGVADLCLNCHEQGGSLQADYGPPIVKSLNGSSGLSESSPDPIDFATEIAAGGDFYYANSVDGSGDWAIGYGHNVPDTSGLTPPGGDTPLTDNGSTLFTCTNCHDPHGVVDVRDGGAVSDTINDYRNLKKTPTGSGSTSVTLDTSVNEGESYITLSTGEDVYPITGNTYAEGANGIARWCATCHDSWHEDIASGGNNDGTDWQRHPVDEPMVGGLRGNVTDWANYVSLSENTKLPMAGGTVNNNYYGDTTSDGTAKVSCISCHFAHAGPFKNALRWNYADGVDDSVEGCNQCHNK